jgi:NADH-quinone oxidoreductase subunit K
MTVPAEHALALAAVLFSIGLAGVLARRNIIFMLMSIEVMLNSAGLAFISAGYMHRDPDGQVMFIFILAMAAAEVAVGLSLALRVYGSFKSLDSDAASSMRG